MLSVKQITWSLHFLQLPLDTLLSWVFLLLTFGFLFPSLSAAGYKRTWPGLGEHFSPVHQLCEACVWRILPASECSFCSHCLHAVTMNMGYNLYPLYFFFLPTVQTKKYADVIIPRGVDNTGEYLGGRLCFLIRIWFSDTSPDSTGTSWRTQLCLRLISEFWGFLWELKKQCDKTGEGNWTSVLITLLLHYSWVFNSWGACFPSHITICVDEGIQPLCKRFHIPANFFTFHHSNNLQCVSAGSYTHKIISWGSERNGKTNNKNPMSLVCSCVQPNLLWWP